MSDLNANVEAILTREEGFRGNIYDDADGTPIKPGVTCKGNPTVGYGLALNVSPLTQDESLYLLRNRYQTIIPKLTTALDWFGTLDPARQAVFVSMAYQLGIAGLLQFTGTLHAAAIADWTNCAAHMLDSLWARQTPSRAQRMAEIIRTGIIGPQASH